MSRARFLQRFYSFQQLLKYPEFMWYDVLSWLQKIYIATSFLFTCHFLLQLFSSGPTAQNVSVI